MAGEWTMTTTWGNGDCNKGGGQATPLATKRAMAMARCVEDAKEGNGNGNKSDGNGNEGGG
jgi:hypothetical protein